ncbi:outer membrane beta-barrel protein [Membranihabitans marinus]
MATVGLLTAKDSILKTGVVTDLDGGFVIEDVDAGSYIIEIKYLGYETFFKPLSLTQSIQTGVIKIMEASTTLDEVVIQGEASMSIQKGDTTQYNASAFTTLADASGQDLVEKMPGITVQDGQLQAQGENVQQILIDGKPFFGKDVAAALQSLPADIIDNIQIFDKKSEKAELSGFDDGNEAKTINIVTKPDRKRGQFGKTTAGHGLDKKYMVGASVNFFNNDRRITVTGLSNNVNAVKYTADPDSQGETRTQDGIINTNTIGIQYSNDWNDKLEVSGSYQYSNRENFGEAYLLRQYVLASDSGQIYQQESEQNRLNQDHNFNFRMEYEMDDRNKLIVIPSVSLKNDKNNNSFHGATRVGDRPINESHNASTSDNLDYDIYNRAYFSHKFDKERRTFTLSSNLGLHSNLNEGRHFVQTDYYEGENSQDLLNQEIQLDRTGFSWGVHGSYTEPLGDNSMLELEYEVAEKYNDSDRYNYDIAEDKDNEFAIIALDTSLSNVFDNRYMTQEVELGYQYKVENFRVQTEIEYQTANLLNDQVFPAPFEQDRTFSSFLPRVRMNYKFSKNTNIEFNYHTWTREPNISQLQNVLNNSNPLRLRSGNPDLDQAYNHRLKAKFRTRNSETEESFFSMVQSSMIDNYVANSTLIAEEPIQLEEGVVLEEGSQFIKPVNVNGYWNIWSYFNYGRPIPFIQSNFNVFASMGYTKRPGVINDEFNYANSKNFRVGLSISSNISDQIDFKISTRSSYSTVSNTLSSSIDNNFYNQSTSLRYNWIIWKGLVYRTNINHLLNTGLSEGYNNSYVLVNMSVGKKFLKQDRGELSLNVYDLLDQNNNIRRNVSEIYIEDRQSNVLQRYFMLSFTYNIRHFSKGTTEEDYDI